MSGPDGGARKVHLLPERAEVPTDPGLWKRFAEAKEPEAWAESWLALQCRMIPGVQGAILMTRPPGNETFAPVAFWPERSADLSQLADVSRRALAERQPIVHKPDAGSHDAAVRLAYPIQLDGRLHGVVSLELAPRSETRLNSVMRQLQWGSAWLELRVRRDEAGRGAALRERQKTALDLVATLVDQDRLFAALSAFVTEFASRLDCDRVSLGLLRRKQIQLQVLSHSSGFGGKTNLVRAIEAAMEEVLDQRGTVVFPASAGTYPQITRAHAELARLYGAGSICSVPLASHGRTIGVLTLEGDAKQGFDESAVELCEAVASLAGPVVDALWCEQRPLRAKVLDALRQRLRQLSGAGHAAAKLGAVALTAAALFLAFARGEYRVAAETVLEPLVRRAVVAPYDGYVSEAPIRPGDVLRKGELLGALDDRELRLDRARVQSEHEQARRRYRQALADRDAAEVEILSAVIQQTSARLALIDDKLDRARMAAPFAGIVIAGDLSQALGAPVRRGDVLFEIAPLDAYRVILEVDDRDISEVEVGQRGDLLLSAFPDEPVAFVVETVTPVSESIEGRNYFRVEARLESRPDPLRPGMEGVGKIEVGRRRLLWIWTHEMIDWLRLLLWRWLP